MSAGRTVLVLGGGVGGITAANHLRSRLPRTDRVVLVERATQHVFQPSLLWILSGDRTPRRISRPLFRMLRAGIDIVQGEVTSLDVERRAVRVADRTLAADAVVVALGAELNPDTVPGLSQGGHNLYTLEGTVGAHEALRTMPGGRVVVLTASPAYKCPAAPYEAAMLLQDFGKRHRWSTSVSLYAAEPGPMGTAGPEVSRAVRSMVEETGVIYHPEHQVASVDVAARRLLFTNGAGADYDLLLYVPPHVAPAVLRSAGLLAGSGWVAVDRHTMATAADGVFAIGDATGIPLPSGKPLPKAGVFAHRQGEVVAANLADAWSGRTPSRRFDGSGACFIETGGGRAGYGSGNFYADPLPLMRLRPPARWWHWGKVLFERRWLHRQR